MKGGYPTKKAAESAVRDRLRSAEQGVGVYKKGTVGDYLVTEWLPGIRTTIKPTTFDGYGRKVNTHLVPGLGAVQLRDLSPAMLNKFYAEMGTSGRRPRASKRLRDEETVTVAPSPGLSARTVRLAHVTIHRALKDAGRWRKLARNPADDADPPKEVRTKMAYWSPAEARQFLGAITGERLYPLFLVALTTGMRRGELAGLA